MCVITGYKIQKLPLSGYSPYSGTELNSLANGATLFKILSFTQNAFCKAVVKTGGLKKPGAILVEILSPLNWRIDKFSGGNF